MNGVALGHKLDLAVDVAEQLTTGVYLEPEAWRMFTALRASGYPKYSERKYDIVGDNPNNALVHLLARRSLDGIANIRNTMDGIANNIHHRPDGVSRTVCFQTMSFHRIQRQIFHPSRVIHCEPTTFSDHSTQAQLQAFTAMLSDLGFQRDNVSLLQKYGESHDRALQQIWPM